MVDGQIESQHSAIALPSIPIEAYDPGTDPRVVRPMNPDYTSGATIDGLARREGDLLINTGLILDNGLLFVRGNLRRYEGTLTIEPIAEGRSLVTYELIAQPGMRLPRSWQQAAVARGTYGFIHCLRGRLNTVLYGK